ncbi:MAG: exodeoxyribonuclease VII small subunit [Clostridia bacterium]|nr:exodeoxyribonuclease VII small subunit [Clostridia bacterium]
MEYEKNLQQLEEIVKRLESGKVSLDESIELFEQGVSITKACLTDLTEYKGKISVIQGEVEKLFKEEN